MFFMDENEITPPNERETAPDAASEPTTEPRTETEAVSPVPARVIRRVPRPRPVESTVPTEFLWLMLPIAFALGLGTGWLLWSGRLAPAVDQSAGAATRYEVAESGNPAIGPEDAPVKIIEFSDYQCPFCKRWYDDVKARLLADYEGQIRFVYRDLPLSNIHPQAQSAAEAANCAGEQKAYWQYHDALFGAKYGLGEAAYSKYAADLALNVNDFDICMLEHRYQKEVNDDASVGVGLGLTGTPTFFVNGLKLVGAQPYEVFKQIIDNELKTAAAKNQ